MQLLYHTSSLVLYYKSLRAVAKCFLGCVSTEQRNIPNWLKTLQSVSVIAIKYLGFRKNFNSKGATVKVAV